MRVVASSLLAAEWVAWLTTFRILRWRKVLYLGAVPGPAPLNLPENEELRCLSCLLHEQGDELHLLLGMPDWWLERGKEIRIERAPTHFGIMSLRLRGTATGVEVKLDPPRLQPPKRIVLHLPTSRPVLKAPNGVDVVYRPDKARRWDFPAVIEAYRMLPAPPLNLDK